MCLAKGIFWRKGVEKQMENIFFDREKKKKQQQQTVLPKQGYVAGVYFTQPWVRPCKQLLN